jgi:hypothetical protein
MGRLAKWGQFKAREEAQETATVKANRLQRELQAVFEFSL